MLLYGAGRWGIPPERPELLPGLDLTPLSNQFVDELLEVAILEAEAKANSLEQIAEEMDGG